MSSERVMRSALVSIAITGLVAGLAATLAGRLALANLCWTLATLPVIAGLAVSIARDLLSGRLGVDAIALVSMSAAVALGQPLAGAGKSETPATSRLQECKGLSPSVQAPELSQGRLEQSSRWCRHGHLD